MTISVDDFTKCLSDNGILIGIISLILEREAVRLRRDLRDSQGAQRVGCFGNIPKEEEPNNFPQPLGV